MNPSIFVCLLLVVLYLQLTSSTLIKGWRQPRFPSLLGKDDFQCGNNCTCETGCNCGTDEGVCNVKCPGPKPGTTGFSPICDPTGNIIVQSAIYACGKVDSVYTGGTLNGGRPLKIPGQFTSVGASVNGGVNCSTLRLGDQTFRQIIQYDLFPYVREVPGFFDLTIYEKACGSLDDLRTVPFPANAKIFKSNSSAAYVIDDFLPEAFAISLGVGMTPDAVQWTPYRFQGVDIRFNTTSGLPIIEASNRPNTTSYEYQTETYMTAVDFADFGLPTWSRVSSIRIQNLLATDRVYGGASDNTTGWVAFDGLNCTSSCSVPKFLMNSLATAYGPNSYDPDFFWISEISDSQRDIVATMTTGTTGSTTGASTGTTATPASTGTTGSTGGGSPSSTGSTGSQPATTGTTANPTGTSGFSTGSTGTSATTGFPPAPVITAVSPVSGSSSSVLPNGVTVTGTGMISGPNFRCVYGGSIFVSATSIGTTSVVCPGPPTNDMSSHLPQTIQLANDYRYMPTFSNSLAFTRTTAPTPSIIMIDPHSADRNCLQKGGCPTINVYGKNLAGATSYQCLFFDSPRPGQYRGVSVINGTTWDHVVCPQIPPYRGPISGTNVTRTNGFYLSLYQSVSGYVATAPVSFTYTA